ncbi:hypothetical protein C8R43DRAFT_906223 [Mycena crocata]|nr:hypothetical protein C8R43DRAFT_906223 [Mycena crocata]
MEELKAEQAVFLATLLSLHHKSDLLTPCGCDGTRERRVGCNDCLQCELLCPQCWLNKHQTMPTHWALVWNAKDQFFEKHDFSRVMKSAVISLGHHGQRCPDADLGRSFTLVDTNGIHTTIISFCRCRTVDGHRGEPEFQQLLRAGIFPGSVKEPKTGYTLVLLEYYRQLRSQGKGSAYNFVRVLQRMADPFFVGSVPDIYTNLLAITRFHENLENLLRHGHAHGPDEPIPGETECPYPNRQKGWRGTVCGACPERGVNMPLNVLTFFLMKHSHLISRFLTIDGNFKQNLFFKRDDGSDIALTDGAMYFPVQADFKKMAATYVVSEEDKVPCKAHIGSIRHQGSVKYGNTAVSGVVGCACDHAVLAAFIDMIKGEAYALGTYAQWEALKHTNSPPHDPSCCHTPTVFSYDSWCLFCVNLVKRAKELFPEEEWFHTLLESVEGQIPADHIKGHGIDCQTVWQAVYAACRAHFHGETAEVIWAFLNPLGSSMRQSTGAARHDIINFVMDSWNTWKVYRQAELLAEERLDALRLFELHMAVVEDLSRQHASEVAEWSRLSRLATKSMRGPPKSVYQHESTKVLTIDNVLAGMIGEERVRLAREQGGKSRGAVAEWIHDGIQIERQQYLAIAFLESHREHPIEDTWTSITKLRNALNPALKKFREQQRAIYPHLKLSGLDVDEPELTAIQLPSYRMKHGQRDVDEDRDLRAAEIKLRCSQADSGIVAVRGASLALSAVKRARDDDYRGQAGTSRTQRNWQKAELGKTFEIDMYNRARDALIYLGHMAKDAMEPYPPLTHRDTRRKETHLHRATGDSRLFDGTAWYLQSGVRLKRPSAAWALSPTKRLREDDDETEFLMGTQTMKRAGRIGSPRKRKRPRELKDIAPEDVRDGRIWIESMAPHVAVLSLHLWWILIPDEGDRVQWFRAEAEMYRWLELYERKHAELWRVITRFERDGVVWAGRADRTQSENGGAMDGTVTYARMQAAMYRRLQHNAVIIFKSADSGAHHDWVSSTSYDELVTKIDGWRDVVFKWMDDMVSGFSLNAV